MKKEIKGLRMISVDDVALATFDKKQIIQQVIRKDFLETRGKKFDGSSPLTFYPLVFKHTNKKSNALCEAESTYTKKFRAALSGGMGGKSVSRCQGILKNGTAECPCRAVLMGYCIRHYQRFHCES